MLDIEYGQYHHRAKGGMGWVSHPLRVPKKRTVLGRGQPPLVCKPLKLRDVTIAQVDSLYET